MRRVMVSKYNSYPAVPATETEPFKPSRSAWEDAGIALFHQFGANYEESSEGFGNYSTAIVEWPDGKVEMVMADRIRFLDPVKVGVDLGSPDGDKSVETIAHREGDKVVIDSVREIPAQDSGAALVGVECWVGDDGGKWSSDAGVILGYDPRFGCSRVTKNPESDPFMCWIHAHPVALGLPS